MNIPFTTDITCAQNLDNEFPASFRNRFFIPKNNGQEVIYFCGNSLGLQPKSVAKHIQDELNQWANLGVEGHFEGDKPWMHYHKFSKKGTAKIVGALEEEVVMMNSLTTNMHLLLVSFFQPTQERFKIITEAGAFSSDQYALETQVRLHGFNPDEAIVELKPREGEYTLRTEDILQAIEEHKATLALVFLGGVNYFTGQAFDMKTVAQAATKANAKVGFDLAHAVGNIALSLHDWQVDFAVWCSYKYLNAGPGGVGGAFVHQKHATTHLPRFGGWWAQQEDERFQMKKGFKPSAGADGWQLSNAPILPLASYMASLEIFEEAGIENLVNRSQKLTSYLEFLLINSKVNHLFKIITPTNANERGCQLSLIFEKDGKKVFKHLQENNIIVDWREPNVIRVSPVPLYNTFTEVFDFVKVLEGSNN